MKSKISDENRSLASRRVLDSLFRLTSIASLGSQDRDSYFTVGAIKDNLRDNERKDVRYGAIGNHDVTRLLTPSFDAGLVHSVRIYRSENDFDADVELGIGFRTVGDKPKLEEAIGDIS